jgi:hypothetical protein
MAVQAFQQFRLDEMLIVLEVMFWQNLASHSPRKNTVKWRQNMPPFQDPSPQNLDPSL